MLWVCHSDMQYHTLQAFTTKKDVYEIVRQQVLMQKELKKN